MSALLAAWTVLAVAAGAFFFLAGSVGLLRFPDTLSRLHALGKADNLGLGLIVLGVAPHAGGALGVAKLLVVWALAQLAAATVTQAVGRAARRSEPPA